MAAAKIDDNYQIRANPKGREVDTTGERIEILLEAQVGTEGL